MRTFIIIIDSCGLSRHNKELNSFCLWQPFPQGPSLTIVLAWLFLFSHIAHCGGQGVKYIFSNGCH